MTVEPGRIGELVLVTDSSSQQTHTETLSNEKLKRQKQSSQWLIVGTLVAPQGLQGEIKVKPNSDFPERFQKPGKRWLKRGDEAPREVELVSGRKSPGKSIYIIRLAGISNRNSAKELVGQKLMVPCSNRPNLKEGEFHFLDLVGLEAKLNEDSESIGEVTDLISAGNDLLEIKIKGGKKILVPLVHEIVPEINLKSRWLIIKPPPGLLDL